MRKKVPALLLFAVLAICSANALTPVPRQQTSSIVPGARTGHNEALAHEITELFNEDQGMISDLESARKDPAFEPTYQSYAHQVEVELNDPNFFFAALFELWAQKPDAPEVVRRYAAFHKSTDARIESIVAQDGWPQRATVGNEAAAQFFFLFGHADDDNAWRLTERSTLTRVFREDHVTPRMYAHLCDRLANVAGKPQIYGTIMGPDQATPGAAKLYWPLSGTIAATDKRRAQIGLPSIEDDLEKFRQGATIGPYMTPLTKGMQWTIADVYTTHQALNRMEHRTSSRAGGGYLTDTKTVIEQAYSAFNRRNLDGALALMTEDVSWPKASEGGKIIGKEEIRAYWTRQWGEFDPHVEPLEITESGNGKVRVRVHQLVKSLQGDALSDSEVLHVFTVNSGLIAAMDLGDEVDSAGGPTAAFAHRA